MQTFFIKPKAGLRVLDPDMTPPQPLPSEGKDVPRNAYWLRRLAAGEVAEAKPAKGRKE